MEKSDGEGASSESRSAPVRLEVAARHPRDVGTLHVSCQSHVIASYSMDSARASNRDVERVVYVPGHPDVYEPDAKFPIDKLPYILEKNNLEERYGKENCKDISWAVNPQRATYEHQFEPPLLACISTIKDFNIHEYDFIMGRSTLVEIFGCMQSLHGSSRGTDKAKIFDAELLSQRGRKPLALQFRKEENASINHTLDRGLFFEQVMTGRVLQGQRGPASFESFNMVNRVVLDVGGTTLNLLVFSETDAVVTPERSETMSTSSSSVTSSDGFQGRVEPSPAAPISWEGVEFKSMYKKTPRVAFTSIYEKILDNHHYHRDQDQNSSINCLICSSAFFDTLSNLWKFWFQSAIVGCKYLVIGQVHSEESRGGSSEPRKPEIFHSVNRIELESISKVFDPQTDAQLGKSRHSFGAGAPSDSEYEFYWELPNALENFFMNMARFRRSKGKAAFVGVFDTLLEMKSKMITMHQSAKDDIDSFGMLEIAPITTGDRELKISLHPAASSGHRWRLIPEAIKRQMPPQ